MPVLAQHSKHQDVLRTHRGWVLRGQAEMNPDSSQYTITTETGNEFVFEAEEVLSLTREDRLSTTVPVKREGWYLVVQTGLLAGTTSENNPFVPNSSIAGFNLQTSGGYRFLPQVSLGIGTGLSVLPLGLAQPIFAELRGEVFARSVTPHYFLAMGFLNPLFNHSEDPWNRWPEVFPPKGGLLYEAGIGIKINRPGLAWLVTAGFRSQTLQESYRQWGGVRIERTYAYQRIALQLGMMF